jgi:hypothetical protein
MGCAPLQRDLLNIGIIWVNEYSKEILLGGGLRLI